MTLAVPTCGKESLEREYTVWNGEPPRDEMFWLTQINKSSLLINTSSGLIEEEKASEWARGLRELEKESSVSGAYRPKMVIHYEPELIKKCGIDVTALHAGRSSQDMHSTFNRAIYRDEILKFAANLNSARRALLNFASENKGVVVPCYTNGVAAQPNALSHVVIGHLEGFRRDFENLRHYYKQLNLCPMGAMVLNGTGWPLSRTEMAAKLGFDGIVDNTFDATQISATDVALGLASALIQPLIHVTQFIQDLMVQYSQAEPWILVGSTYRSSAMPQKRNPGALIDIRRDANTVLGNIQNIYCRAINLPTGMYDVKDACLNGEIIRDAVKVMENFSKVIPLLQVNGERALRELNSDWTASQELADVLMRDYGLPFRVGHKISSRMVGFARQNHLTPLTFPYEKASEIYREVVSEFEGENFPEIFPLSADEFAEVFDPRKLVGNRNVTGGPQEPELSRQFGTSESFLREDESWLEEKVSNIEKALSACNDAFQDLCDRI